jgi:Tol biopolymer transport system component
MHRVKFLLILMVMLTANLIYAQENTPEADSPSDEILFLNVEGGEREVVIMNSGGEILRTLPDMDNSVAHFRWSPDGSEIAYIGQGANGMEIFVIDADGSNRRQLTDNNTRELLPVWSPDGTEIVFSSTRAGNVQLFIMNAQDGSDVRQLTTDAATYHPTDWHPGGEWIAASKVVGPDSDVVLLNITTNEEVAFTDWDSTDGIGRWSPDGSRFAWHSNQEGYGEIFMVDFEESLEHLPLGGDSEFVQQLTFPTDGWLGHTYFSWSPDGQFIVMDVMTDDELPFGDGASPNLEINIHLLNIETGDITILTSNDTSSIPEWRP